MQLEEDAGGFDRGGLAPHVVASEAFEVELRAARALPEKINVQFIGKTLRLGQQLARRWLLERQKNTCRAHLAAAAMGTLHLERRGGLRENRARLELALLLIQDVHFSALQS